MENSKNPRTAFVPFILQWKYADLVVPANKIIIGRNAVSFVLEVSCVSVDESFQFFLNNSFFLFNLDLMFFSTSFFFRFIFRNISRYLRRLRNTKVLAYRWIWYDWRFIRVSSIRSAFQNFLYYKAQRDGELFRSDFF